MKQKIRISHLTFPLKHEMSDIEKKVQKKLKVSRQDMMSVEIIKQSVDARRKAEIHYEYTVDVCLTEAWMCQLAQKGAERRFPWLRDKNISLVTPKVYRLPPPGRIPLKHRPVVIGSGPAGLFCAYVLALQGYCPLILERGADVDQRTADVEKFWDTGELDTSSNVQFGEGGAGTFSDGKLNTLVKDKYGRSRFVLETFVKFGAPEDILYVNKPHIGTDVLKQVLKRMRSAMTELGAEYRFHACVTDFSVKESALWGVIINDHEFLPADAVVLAPGHSARDTFQQLKQRQIPMEAKPFAVGFRVEHPQDMIQMAQFRTTDRAYLPAAIYKVTSHASDGRGVYSFCMCPGGYVVNASSEEERCVVNGMSYHDRGSANANSAMIITVSPEDFDSGDVLAGVEFQRSLEHRAYEAGAGSVPQQLFGDFEQDRTSKSCGSFPSCLKGKGTWTNLRGILPENLNRAFLEGMHQCGFVIEGFDRQDAILSGVETRTSSPVRILRNEGMESEIAGLYPCGEGAGYAGGIMSAAMDGLKVAEAMIEKHRSVQKWQQN